MAGLIASAVEPPVCGINDTAPLPCSPSVRDLVHRFHAARDCEGVRVAMEGSVEPLTFADLKSGIAARNEAVGSSFVAAVSGKLVCRGRSHK